MHFTIQIDMKFGIQNLTCDVKHVGMHKLDVHRTHTPRCEVKKIIALWRMHAVMQGWKEVGCED